MKAIVVEHGNRGGPEKLVAKLLPKPFPEGYDLLVRIEAASVNRVDTRVRSGVNDDYPDYYDRCPQPDQVCGFDGAGIVEGVGNWVSKFRVGDEVFFAGSPIRQGSNAEYQLVDERSVALKPKNLSFVQAVSMPMTYITAFEALVERLEIQPGEKAALLIINGAKGVGAMAIQIARRLLNLPIVITTASSPDSETFCKSKGATHVVNQRDVISSQISSFNLTVPLRYIFITHKTDTYLPIAAALCTPFGKVCSVVPCTGNTTGTEFMGKSLTFVCALSGTKLYYGVELESQGVILDGLRREVEMGRVECTLEKTFELTVQGLRAAHKEVELGGKAGKNALFVPDGPRAFA